MFFVLGFILTDDFTYDLSGQLNCFFCSHSSDQNTSLSLHHFLPFLSVELSRQNTFFFPEFNALIDASFYSFNPPYQLAHPPRA